jgi:glycosyltransferase involved in cell wall biosynthesis
VEKDKVSIIIPFYSRVDWLIKAVESALNQTYKNLEIIVINDGSSEDLTDFINCYSDRIKYIEKPNTGPGDTRNMGIKYASGDYLSFLDSDDIWLPHKTTEQIAFMRKEGYVWSHTGGAYFYDNTDRIKKFNFSRNSGNVSKSGIISMKVATPSVTIYSSILKNNPEYRFNATLRFSQDTFLYQLLSQKYVLGYYDKECVLIRIRNKEGDLDINASRRFRIRFSSRSFFYDYLRGSENKFIYNLPLSVRIVNYLYFLLNKFLTFLELRGTNQMFVELMSKFLYIFMYFIGEIFLLFISRKKNIRDE